MSSAQRWYSLFLWNTQSPDTDILLWPLHDFEAIQWRREQLEIYASLSQLCESEALLYTSAAWDNVEMLRAWHPLILILRRIRKHPDCRIVIPTNLSFRVLKNVPGHDPYAHVDHESALARVIFFNGQWKQKNVTWRSSSAKPRLQKCQYDSKMHHRVTLDESTLRVWTSVFEFHDEGVALVYRWALPAYSHHYSWFVKQTALRTLYACKDHTGSLAVPPFLLASHNAFPKSKVSWAALWGCEVNFSSYYCRWHLYSHFLLTHRAFEYIVWDYWVYKYWGNNWLAPALLLLLLCVVAIVAWMPLFWR